LTRSEKLGGRPAVTEVTVEESAFNASVSGPRQEPFIEGGKSDCVTSRVEAERVSVVDWSEGKVLAAVVEGVREPNARSREPEGGLNWDGIGDLMEDAECLSC